MSDTEYRAEQIAAVAREIARLDLVKVVRCRDCVHFMRGNLCNRQDEWNEFHWLDVEPNGFCAWGKRKEGGE